MRILALTLLLSLAACSPGGAPQEAPSGETVHVENGWAAPTPGGVDVSAGYLTIVNDANTPDALIGAASPRSAMVEVHEMSMDGSVMQMRPVARLDIQAGGSMELAPGGRHLMFVGVTQPFVDGETIPVTLQFESAGAIEVALPVRPVSAPGGH